MNDTNWYRTTQTDNLMTQTGSSKYRTIKKPPKNSLSIK
jgi:hypothetical protein